MPGVAVYIVIFVGLGAFFLFFHLLMGKFVRPIRPEDDKLTIYECGEPTIGSAWVQFDLRYYVVALLFVIFDVEVAFFFPWAIVFGKANSLTHDVMKPVDRAVMTKQLGVTSLPPTSSEQQEAFAKLDKEGMDPEAASLFAKFGFVDILVFFGVLLVGFAYLWKRGDINWIRTTVSEQTAAPPEPALSPARQEELVGR